MMKLGATVVLSFLFRHTVLTFQNHQTKYSKIASNIMINIEPALKNLSDVYYTFHITLTSP